MVKRLLLSLVCVTVLFAYGCTQDFRKEDITRRITHPLETQMHVRLGETKDEVLEKWGEPDRIVKLGRSRFGLEREEWIYHGRYPAMPVDYRYVSKTKHLYFEGNALVDYKTEEEAATKKK